MRVIGRVAPKIAMPTKPMAYPASGWETRSADGEDGKGLGEGPGMGPGMGPEESWDEELGKESGEESGKDSGWSLMEAR